MATGSDLPTPPPASRSPGGQTEPAARMVPDSPAQQNTQKALKRREPPCDREPPQDRVHSQEPERRTVGSAESDRAERANSGRAGWGLNGGDRRFLTVVSTVALVLMAAHWFRLTQWSTVPVEVDRPAGEPYRFMLDANQATWVEWMQLEGIGEVLARRIVEDREQRGPFPNVDALDRVPGIGPKTLARIRANVVVREVASQEAAVPEPRAHAMPGNAD